MINLAAAISGSLIYPMYRMHALSYVIFTQDAMVCPSKCMRGDAVVYGRLQEVRLESGWQKIRGLVLLPAASY